jgi:FtsZ-binding cell division protein ZapB
LNGIGPTLNINKKVNKKSIDLSQLELQELKKKYEELYIKNKEMKTYINKVENENKQFKVEALNDKQN